MKKFLSFILAALMAFSVISTAFAADILTNELMIYDSQSGKALPIIISSDAGATDRTAASKLQYYLKECTGADFEIISKGNEGIFVGSAGAEKMDMSSLNDEDYRIKAVENGLAIAGIGKRGTIYGVFAFLKDFCGCRWFSDKLIVTPEAPVISIAKDTDVIFNQTFEYRETDWISPTDPEFSLANQLNSGVYRHFDEANGSNVNYIGPGFCHTLANSYCAASKYFETKPELFALHNGKRTGDQLCLSNEETYQIVLDEVMGYLANVDKNDKNLQILSLTQHDNQHYCMCDKCKASDEKYGSHAGSLLLFINRIAEAVENAGYKNVAIDTFAYQYTRKTPVGIVPRDNVIVRLCSIECCFCHPLDDPKCSKNADFMDDLRAWSKICDRLYIWDYTTNYAHTLITFSDFGVIQKNMQIFAENGVKGVYEEGAYYAKAVNGEFADLRAYLLSRLMIDPYMDYKKEMNEFLEAYYGGAAPFIKEYLDILEKEQSENGHMPIYIGTEEIYRTLRKKDIEHINELWESAVNANGNEFQKANVRRSEITWLAWKAENKKDNFSRLHLPSVWMASNEYFYDRLLEENVTTLSEGSDGLITDPAFRKYIISTDPYFWKTSKLGNEKVINEHTKKYDTYINLEKNFGKILKPLFDILYFVFG